MDSQNTPSSLQVIDGILSFDSVSEALQSTTRERINYILSYPTAYLQNAFTEKCRLILGDVDFDTQAIISLIDTFSTKDEYLMTVAYLRIIPQLENFSCLTPEEKLLKSIFPDHQNAHINVFTTNIENGTKTIFEEYKQLDITDDLDKWLTIRCLENKTLNKQNLSLFIQSYIDEYSAGDESLRKEVKKAIVLYIAKEKTDIVRNFFESFKRLKALRNLKGSERTINGEIALIEGKFGKYLSHKTIQERYPDFISSLPTNLYVPLFGKGVNFQSWAKRIFLTGNGARLRNGYNSIAGLNSIDELTRLFIGISDKEISMMIYIQIVEYVNSPSFNNNDLDSVSEYLNMNMGEVLENFQKKVGVIKNAEVLKKIYSHRQIDLLGSIDQYVYSKMYRPDMPNFEDEEDDEPVDPILHENIELQGVKSSEEFARELYLQNPTHEFLKNTFALWNQQYQSQEYAPEGKKNSKKIPLISSQELNALSWIVNNLPTTGRGRDDRRKLHNFVLELSSSRYLQLDENTTHFKGELITKIKRNFIQPGEKNPNKYKSEQQDLARSFIGFTSILSSLPIDIQSSFCEQIHPKLQEFYARNSGEILLPDDYDELGTLAIRFLVENMLKNTISLSSTQVSKLRLHIQENQTAWNKNDMIIRLAKYHSFANEAGKKSTEQYLMKLCISGISEDSFKNISRYNWGDEKTTKWFGTKLKKAIQQGTEKVLTVSEKQEDTRKMLLESTVADIFLHLNLPEQKNIEELSAYIRENLGANPHSELLIDILSEIWSHIHEGKDITVADVSRWKLLMQKVLLDEAFQDCREVLINMDQLLITQTKKAKEIKEFTFRITEDPNNFIMSAEEPFYTCQRIIEATRYNQGGEPINRIRQGQFFLANARIGENVDTRAILEIARERDEGKKVLLVERMYSRYEIPGGAFQDQIIEWAKNTEVIDYIAFSNAYQGTQNLKKKIIGMKLLPSDGDVYRDTQWSNNISVLELK